MTNEKWWEEMITDEAKQKSDIVELVGFIVSEAERRGYERAMEEVAESLQFDRIGKLYASCPTCHEKHTIAGVKEEEFIIHVPKSFFEK